MKEVIEIKDGKLYELWANDDDGIDYDKCKIIGHPIYPHHILQRGKDNNAYIRFSSDLRNNFKYIFYDRKREIEQIEYIGTREPEKDLYGQSDETIDSLYSLIQQVKGTNN